MKLFPWQRWLAIHALELLPSGKFRFRFIIVLVARQNGKSMLSVVLALWALFVLQVYGVLGTAQDLDTAEDIWSQGVALVTEVDDEGAPVRPDLHAAHAKVVNVNGGKALITRAGGRWKVKAANRKAGRGLTGDLVLMDELREQTNWLSWAAITKTTNSRPNAQVWGWSNAGDYSSVVLRHMRLKAHEALGDPDGAVAADERMGGAALALSDVEFDAWSDKPAFQDEDGNPVEDVTAEELDIDPAGIFLAEWSARPGCSKWDREQWAQANPSMGYMLDEKTIAGDCATDPEEIFRVEDLCQWLEGTSEEVFPAGAWAATANELDPDGQLWPQDRIVGEVVVGLSMGMSRSHTFICAAGRRADGVAQVELVAARFGSDWVRGWLEAHADRIEAVTGQQRGAPIAPLLEELRADKTFLIPVIPCGGIELAGAHGLAHDWLRDRKVRHNPQPILDVAFASAVKKEIAGGWVLAQGDGSQGDAAALSAWVFALWMLHRQSATPPPPPPAPAPLALSKSSSSGRAEINQIGF